MESQMKTRYYVVNKAEQATHDSDGGPGKHTMSTTLPMLGLSLNSNTKSNHKISSDLKHADDGEIYLADNAPDFLFDDWERRKNAALIGFELTIPSVASDDNDDKHNNKETSTTSKINRKKKELPTDSGDSSEDKKNTSGTTTSTTRRVASNRRAALMRQSSKRPSSTTTATTIVNINNTDTSAAAAATSTTTSSGVQQYLIKSESKRKISTRPNELTRSVSSTESTERKISKSRQSSSKDDNAIPKNSQRGGSSSTKKEDPEIVLYDLLNNLDPLRQRHKIDEEKVIELIEKYPKICSKKYDFFNIYTSGDTTYPLHMLCCFGASLATIKLCYKIYAEAIDYISATREMTCLHYAVLYTRASLDVIQFLMKKDPGAISAVSKKHQTPLHIACSCSPTIKTYNPDVILLLTELSSKEVLMKVDKHGRTPLHIACGLEDPCLEVIEDLTEVNSEACTIQCYDFHSTPLHLACSNRHVNDENHCIVNIIKDLIRSNPNAVKMKDVNGQLPIYVAVTNKSCFKICKMLIKKYPECLEITDNKGMTLYELGKKRQLDSTTIELLNPYED
jgi:Ankyrin repeats (3 copies)/Ankyrin repeat